MNMPIAAVAVLLSTMVCANPHDHVLVKGAVPHIMTAETMTAPVRQALSEIVPISWSVFVDSGLKLSNPVQVEGDTNWLDNLDRIGAAENALVVVDAHNQRITLQSQPAPVQVGSK